MLGLEPEKTIYDLVVAPGELDSEKLAGYTTKHASRPRRPPGAAAPGGCRARHRGQARPAARGCARVLRRDRRRHLAVLPRADAGDARPHGRAAAALRPRRADAQERAALACRRSSCSRSRRAAIRFVLNRANRRSGMKQSEVEGALERKIAPRAAVRPGGAARASTAATRRARRRGLRLLARRCASSPRRRSQPSRRRRSGGTSPRSRRRSDMGLHDRLKPDRTGPPADRRRPHVAAGRPSPRRSRRPSAARSRPVRRAEDAHPPRVHREARPRALQAARRRTSSERVLHAVTEQLALDRTPLTREERRQIVREIADDILGYGPLEPLLRDDSVTEVMVNALRPDLRRALRASSSGRTPRSSTTPTCCASSTRSSRRSAGASTSPRRWSTRACPTAAVSTRSSRRSRSRARR